MKAAPRLVQDELDYWVHDLVKRADYLPHGFGRVIYDRDPSLFLVTDDAVTYEIEITVDVWVPEPGELA